MSNTNDFVIENGVLKKYVGPGGDVVIPEGVTEIKFDAMLDCGISSLHLPATLEKIPVFSPAHLVDFSVDMGNSHYKCVDGVLYDSTTEVLWCYPAGRTGEFYVPDGVKCVMLDSFANAKTQSYQIHMKAGVHVKVEWGDLLTGNSHITIFAPLGSDAERMARRCDCQFVAEGEPVALDDSNERKNRSFQEWRNIFTFTTKSKGVNITKYVRGSKVVYLPDKIGKSEVTAIDKEAFLSDVTVLCSKRLFAKLSNEVKDSTIRSFLVSRELFVEEEQDYLVAYLKKYRADYLQKYIQDEDYPALEACFATMPKVKTLMDECLAITEQLGKQQVNLFLMQFSQK